MLYRSSAFVVRFRMMFAVTSVRSSQFVKVTLAGLMTVLHGIIAARELALKTSVFRFLASTRGSRLAGSVIKPLHNQPLHGSGPRSLFVFTKTVSPDLELDVIPLIYFWFHFRTTLVVSSAYGAHFVKTTLNGPIAV